MAVETDSTLITTENAPLTPIYQLNRELACKVQRNMAIIFETVHFTETTNPESKTVRRRKVTQDLYYLVHLRNSPSRDNLLKYYITAASPETLGNVQLDVTDAQEEGFRAMLNANKSAADILLFNRDTQQLLFDIKPKWQGGQYQWIDVNGVKVASEFGTREEPRLHIEIPLQQQKRDALVALWILRLWYSIAENRTATRQAGGVDWNFMSLKLPALARGLRGRHVADLQTGLDGTQEQDTLWLGKHSKAIFL
ncbi:hypothetical protein FGSG_03098 [Fusarium graminearum PH-1]|uniref:Chromosome 2, complete genome n=1 Tax=Gibberella zeae (strain ATCC MYA-4620 / CBS 123657 / FGSC 9075 / NRRL 31084 / PH-1) TaxID=229533 RepID=I1RH55_GIBZE|nr:hypothetical protein FGSG_03098 [Fusarium graminearum PH-1]ESU10176.1 hypothetical protein FGSG_03098 [Fusarium graminearum PH-1]CEF77832.1 unnamed protein product [Fusarium graminearum]|eukprot:XP_011322675.1 hypothetical protein FGSG_03098 [Fusarium graminearum PH-1]